eukprot:scaffold1396_cov252-Pinguiococcus_pyrenoidosus.AAC.18
MEELHASGGNAPVTAAQQGGIVSQPGQVRSAASSVPADAAVMDEVDEANALQDVDAASGMHKFVRCNGCAQWLQVPVSAKMVFCPLCGVTSDSTGDNTRYPKKKKKKKSKKQPSLFSCFDFTAQDQ